uniref:Srp40 C-terminal domain-containing protein n=1 Tax=Arundo donax TaxID=35708 RepID=A0A0A9D7E0_ARUDO
MDIEEGENGRPSSENAVVGKKRKLEEEGTNPPAKENSTANPTLSNGFMEDNSKENSTISKPSKRRKKSSEPKTVDPFKRVKMENIKFADDRLQDNSYWAKGGAETGYGAKAQEILGQVSGRGFRHEKTKKKRGTYRGGQIDLGTHSIKFENSDDE